MDFVFSVVMAVFNTEPYLRAAVDSLIHQDFSFDKIQLILVDDGSTDASGLICDEYAARYPDNVLVIHKENGGVSSARNAGLEHAQGKYVNFLDSDDRMSSDTFSKVYSFFETHDNETDVVSIPLYFFEGKKGPHILNNKFEKGTRIIDLRTEWTLVQLSGSSTFIRRECFSSLRFNPQLRYAEDAELLQRILLKKQTLGVVAEAAYHYRFRSGSVQSAIQSSTHNPANYLPKIEHYSEALISYCLNKVGEVPKFVQYALMYDLQWHIRIQEFPSEVLTVVEAQEFLKRLYGLLPYLEDEVICAASALSVEHKAFLLKKKHGSLPDPVISSVSRQFLYGGQVVGNLDDTPITIDFLHLEQDHCTIEAFFPALPGMDCLVFAEYNGARLPLEPVSSGKSCLIHGEEALVYLTFQVRFPLLSAERVRSFRFGIEHCGQCFYLPCKFSKTAPLSAVFMSRYYYRAGWCLQYRDGVFSVTPKRRGTKLRNELILFSEYFLGRQHQRKALVHRYLRAVKNRLVLPKDGRIGLLGKLYLNMKGAANQRAEKNAADGSDYPIDFVVAWVDGNDPAWLKQKYKYLASEDSSYLATDASESRYRDWEFFQYWFRAVETYAPWVRNVYLVTCGHLPAWLNTDHPKLKIITHDDYIPKQYLPTFSSHPIELNLWRIPDLSEHFVYFNDDMLLSSPARKEDFFQNGFPNYTAVASPLRAYVGMSAFEHVLLNNLGLFNSVYDFREVISKHPEKWLSPLYGKYKEFNERAYKDHFLSGMQFSHLCYPFRKSTMKACWEAFFSAFDRTCSNKFRSSEDINHQVFQIWEMVYATFTPVKTGYFGSVRNIQRSTIDLVETDLFDDKNICVCLNDGMGFDPADFPFLKTRLLEILMRKFPSKSSFEK